MCYIMSSFVMNSSISCTCTCTSWYLASPLLFTCTYVHVNIRMVKGKNVIKYSMCLQCTCTCSFIHTFFLFNWHDAFCIKNSVSFLKLLSHFYMHMHMYIVLMCLYTYFNIHVVHVQIRHIHVLYIHVQYWTQHSIV